MATTFVKIATVTVGAGGAANMDFTSIPSTYTDLYLNVSARGTSARASNGHFYSIKINNSSANLTQRYIQGDGSSVASGTSSTTTGNYMPPSDYTSNTFSNNYIYLPNYAGSNNKSFTTDSVTENNATESFQIMNSYLWAQTTAINQITLTPGAGNFAQYSTATLYGISKS